VPADDADHIAAAGTPMRGLLDQAPLAALRVLQFAIDLTLVAALCLLPMTVLLVLPRNPDGSLAALLVAIPVILLALAACAVLSWWYLAWWPSRHAGQTVAMRWLGLAVIAEDGRPASALQLGLRWVMLLVDGLFFGAVGLVSILLTRGRQRLGDILAQTSVVRVEPGDRGRAGAHPA
jgi:uncharacterized RDD family membrane protein YckC